MSSLLAVAVVTPSDDASSPSHRDHDRWVKERTLAMEVEHAKLTGGTFRTAEDENIRLLEEMEARAREAPRPPPTPTPSAPSKASNANIGHDRRVALRGVTVREAKPLVPAAKLSPCGRCGTCRPCMRERRVFAVIQKANAGDLVAVQAVWRFAMKIERIKATAPNVLDGIRGVDALAEAFCDDSVKSYGPWR